MYVGVCLWGGGGGAGEISKERKLIYMEIKKVNVC